MAEIRTPTEKRHEPDTVALRGVIFCGIALAVLAVVIHVLLYFLARGMESRERSFFPKLSAVQKDRPEQEQRIKYIPEPRLQKWNDEGLPEIWSREEKILKSYGWSDEEKTSVRIPIEEAMKIMADPKNAQARGLRSSSKKEEKQ